METRQADIVIAAGMTDREIIDRVLNGEKDLYALLVRRYNQRLYRVAISIAGNDTDAEDIIQVAYIRAYENLAKFSFKSGFATWLTRILINESLLRVRKRKRSVETGKEAVHETGGYSTPEKQNPLGNMINSELKVILERSISELPEKYRTVFVMREIENMNVSETGDCLDISETNVKVRLNRAKAMLKKSLDKYYSKEDIFHFHLGRCEKITNAVMKAISSGSQ